MHTRYTASMAYKTTCTLKLYKLASVAQKNWCKDFPCTCINHITGVAQLAPLAIPTIT